MEQKKLGPRGKTDIKTASEAIQITHRVSLRQYKYWLILLKHAQSDITNRAIALHRVPLSVINELIGYVPSRAELKADITKLQATQVEWNIFGKNKEEEWGVCSLLASGRITKTDVVYQFAEELKDKLLNPRMFAILNMQMLNRFSSKYELLIYILCKDFLNVKGPKEIPLHDYRKYLGIDDSEYTDFKRLSTRAIKEPIAEINKVSDIIVDYEYTRENRKVVGIKFRVKENPQLKLDFATLDQVPNIMEAVDQQSSMTDDLLEKIRNFGVSPSVAKAFFSGKRLPKDFSGEVREYLLAKIELTEQAMQHGKVEDPAKYFCSAVSQDWHDSSLEQKKTKARVKREEEVVAEQRRLREELRREFDRWAVENALSTLSIEKRQMLEDDFLIAAKEMDNLKSFIHKGMESAAVKASFRSYVRECLHIQTGDGAFKEFIQTRGHDPVALGL